MKRLYTPLLVIVLLTACKSKKEENEKNKKPAAQAAIVDVIIAQPQTVISRVEVNGTVVSNEFVELRSEVTGRLTYLNVPEGQYIKQGTLIARINDADLQAQLNKSKVALDLAQKTEERLSKLLKVSGINQGDYDAALNTVNSYKADMAYTQSLIDKTVVKAPFSGVMGLRQVSPGAFLTSANVIATLQQVDKIKIDFTLPEEYSNLIHKGGAIDVQLDADKKTNTKATIIASEPQVNQSTRNLKVRAILQSGKPNPGSFVKVYVSSGTNTKAILVPSGAIIPDDKNKQLVVVKNGKAAFTVVKTGVRQADFVEVVSGINPGDSIVVTGILFARPKAALKVRSVKTLEQLKG